MMFTATIFLKDRRKNPIIIEDVQMIKTRDMVDAEEIETKDFFDFSINDVVGELKVIGKNSSFVIYPDELAGIKFEKSN